MLAEHARSDSLLFRRLRLVQRVLPLVASVPIIGYELIEHGPLGRPVAWHSLLTEVVLYGILVPILMFAVFTWVLDRVRERDAAEARLTALYEVTRQSASMTGLEELQELALSLPDRACVPAAKSSLVVEDSPGGAWHLAGARGLSPVELAGLRQGLASGLAGPGRDHLSCSHLANVAHGLNADCQLLNTVCANATQPLESALCLSLSNEPTRRMVLSIYLPNDRALSPQVAETLTSMAAGVAIALDRARLQARERQLFQQIERAVRSQQLGLIPTLERILADVASEHSLVAGAVFLLRREEGSRGLVAAASWPGKEAVALLKEGASRAVGAPAGEQMPAVLTLSGPESSGPSATYGTDNVQATLIAGDGEPLGVLVLVTRPPGALPERSVLGVVTSMMALVIRNSELYAQLEGQAVINERNHLAREVHDGLAQSLGFLNFKVQQVQRLLSRGDVPKAEIALRELREGSQEVYDEARRMIQDLRWTIGGQGSLVQRLEQYCTVLAARTGLTIFVEAGAEPNLPPRVQQELFRVAQEALNNVHRHAGAQRVVVRFSNTPEGVTLIVKDDGRGFQRTDGQTGDHHGLRIMYERVQSIGGELKIESRENDGATICVVVPRQETTSESRLPEVAE